jgi:hypothetical protein
MNMKNLHNLIINYGTSLVDTQKLEEIQKNIGVYIVKL